MNGVSGVGSRVHLRPEDDEETKGIVERDTKVAINGRDRTWREEKEHQQGLLENAKGLAPAAGHTAAEATEMAGFHSVEAGGASGAGIGAAGPIAGAAAGLWLGIHELLEAHAKGDAQNAAISKDNAHVALIGTLDLPDGYKAKRLNNDYKHVNKEDRSPAFKMAERINADPKGRALLQLHADRGMHAAADLLASGMTVEAFLKTNPKVAEQYVKDPAFKEGFDAYLFTIATGSAKEKESMKQGLEDRDGWNKADHVSIRV